MRWVWIVKVDMKIITKGKYAGQSVLDVVKKDPEYYAWYKANVINTLGGIEKVKKKRKKKKSPRVHSGWLKKHNY